MRLESVRIGYDVLTVVGAEDQAGGAQGWQWEFHGMVWGCGGFGRCNRGR